GGPHFFRRHGGGSPPVHPPAGRREGRFFRRQVQIDGYRGDRSESGPGGAGGGSGGDRPRGVHHPAGGRGALPHHGAHHRQEPETGGRALLPGSGRAAARGDGGFDGLRPSAAAGEIPARRDGNHRLQFRRGRIGFGGPGEQ